MLGIIRFTLQVFLDFLVYKAKSVKIDHCIMDIYMSKGIDHVESTNEIMIKK